jgi:tetratricopeptide (TPR) repeat protein
MFTLILGQGERTLAQEEIQVETKSLKDATHIELSGRDEWRYNVTRSPGHGSSQVAIQFIGVKPTQVEDLNELKDTRVKAAIVSEGTNGDALITLTLGQGLNLFDYQTDSPVHLVFDVFKDDSKSKLKSGPKAKKKIAVKAVLKRNVASVDHPEIGSQPLLNSTSVRDPRLEIKNGIFDGGDLQMNRFKILEGDTTPASQDLARIRSVHNLYVHFPMLTLERNDFKTFTSDPAMKYEMPSGADEESLEAKLVIKLFNEGKYAVVLRALKFFREKFPTSRYEKTLEFIVADTYFKLWQRDKDKSDFDSAMTRYKELLNKYPADPSRFHTLMFIGLNYLEGGNLFGALSTLQVGIEKYAESPYLWEMRLAEATVLNQLHKDEASLSAYENIENDPKAGSYGREAHFRRGDVFFTKKDYQRAVTEYKGAIKKFGDHLDDAPNLFFNSAEAQFWLEDYHASLDGFRDFLQRFPTHPYGGYAMTRIGEIFELLGVNHQKVSGAFLESYYRYRGSPGAFMAKLYVNMDRFPKMKTKEVESVTGEINEELGHFNKISDLDPFVTLLLAKGYSKRGEYKTSMDLLTKYYQKYVLSPYLPIFKEYITQTITNEMARHEEAGSSLKSVEIFLANQDTWLAGSNRVDTAYVLGQSYENLNLIDDAIHSYTNCLSLLGKLTPEQLKTESVLENLPTQDEINLRLAAANLKAESLKKAGQYLSEIKNPETLSEEERVERGLILSALAEKEERTDLALLALKELSEHWKGKPELLADAWLRIGRLEATHGNYTNALPWVEKVLTAGNEDPELKKETLKSATELAGDVHSHLGQQKQAIENYKFYLDKYGNSAPVKYKLGKIYFDQKDLRTAGQIWNELKSDDSGKVWSKMADENLAQANWDSKYGRYLDRSPAAVGGGK